MQFALGTSLIVALLSGWRLIWLNHPDLPSWLSHLLDLVSLRGNVIEIHLISAATVLFILSFSIYYLTLSGEGREIFSKPAGVRSIEKGILIVSAMAIVLLTLTGIGMFNGWRNAFGLNLGYRPLHLLFSIVILFCVCAQVYLLIRSRFNKTEKRQQSAASVNFWSLAGALLVALGLLWAFNASIDRPHRLVSKEINRSIFVDGKIREIEWVGSEAATFYIDGREVEIRAIHDRQTAYLAIRWADTTRSANRKLIKTESGWIEQKTRDVDHFGERVFFEDKLALSFSRSDAGCAGSCHLRATSQFGFHASVPSIIDLWSWESVSTNIAREADDGWISIKSSETSNGIRKDNDVCSGAYLNFNREWQEPYFLPIRAIEKDAIWIGTGMAMPYRTEQDTFKVGDQIPAILVENLVGDRGDVTAFGRWHDGYWELELARKRRTGSPHDLNLADTLYLNLAIFDNAEKIHDVQLMPMQLIFE